MHLPPMLEITVQEDSDSLVDIRAYRDNPVLVFDIDDCHLAIRRLYREPHGFAPRQVLAYWASLSNSAMQRDSTPRDFTRRARKRRTDDPALRYVGNEHLTPAHPARFTGSMGSRDQVPPLSRQQRPGALSPEARLAPVRDVN